MSLHRRLSIVLAIAALGLAATGCDDDGGSGESDGTSTESDVTGTQGDVTVTADLTAGDGTSTAGDATGGDATGQDATADVTAPGDADTASDTVDPPTCEVPGPASIAPWQGGSFHAVDGCGQVWTWGVRSQLRDPTTDPTIVPVPETIGEPGYVQLAVQALTVCGLRTDGSVRCWGSGGSGGLGRGDEPMNLVAPEPAQIFGPGDWGSIASGIGPNNLARFCGIRGEGELWCWGWNGDGLLDASLPASLWEPTRIGDASDWASVSLKSSHMCGTRADGTLICWGANDAGQLGDGTVAPDATLQPPVQISGEWTDVQVGYRLTCGLRADDSAWCWGESTWVHRLAGTGGGIVDQEPTPVQVSGSLAVAELYSDTSHLAVVLTDGRVAEIVYDDMGDESLAIDDTIGDGWVDIGFTQGANGVRSTCIARDNGEVWCRGNNDRAQLGQGTWSTLWEPGRVGSESDWAVLEMQSFGACAARPDDVYCWGLLSLFTPENDWRRHQRPTATNGPTGVIEMSLNQSGDLCGVTNAGELHCVGGNTFGLGVDPADAASGVWHRVGESTGWTDVAMSGGGSCGVDSGQIHCWAMSIMDFVPSRFDPMRDDWEAFVMPPYQIGNLLGCGLRASGQLWCLDRDAMAWQVGSESGLGLVEFRTSGPDAWVCALDADGNLLCAGVEPGAPLEPEEAPTTWTDVHLASNGLCGVRDDGTAMCDLRFQQPAAGTGDPPGTGGAALDDTDWSAIDVANAVCGLKGTGELWCWGDGTYGTTGNGEHWYGTWLRVPDIGR